MDVVIGNGPYRRIQSGIVVAKQLQADALERIRLTAGLPDLIAHRILHGLDVPLKMAAAHADLQEAEEDLLRAQQTEAILKGRLIQLREGKE